MMSQDELASWHERANLSLAARSLIDRIRSSQPVRRVGSGRSNVCGRYPSRKMGVTIQFESHHVELAAIYEMEYAPDVLEYYDQPSSLKLEYRSASGRSVSALHTPDFLVIRTSGAGFEEWKTEDDLLRLTKEKPNRYCRGDGKVWTCPPGIAHASSLGLYYRVRSSQEIDWTYQRNLHFLEDYLSGNPQAVSAQVRCAVQSWIAADRALTLADLFGLSDGVASHDEIYSLIALGDIYVDLSSALLVEPDSVRLTATQHRSPLSLAAPVIVDQPQGDVSATAGAVRLQAGPDALAEAVRRHVAIKAHLSGGTIEPHVPDRTIRHWLRSFRQAEAIYGDGFVGLLPRHHQRGNRNARLPDKTRALIAQFIDMDYETLKQKRKFHVYAALLRACEAHGTTAPSYKTFSEEVNRRPQHELVLRRKGRRAAYPHEPPYMELTLTTPRHGEWPFHICHIDHTELDVELRCSTTNCNLGRPWLSILTDAFSRRLLAVFLSFDPPSYRSCMMILRECVRRHGRLPRTLVVDGGKEFESIYFETLLARYECTKKSRPPAQARFGSVCERLFGTASSQFVPLLSGNTQIMKDVRITTRSVNPKSHAIWTLERLSRRLCEWAYEIYDKTPHSALCQSPRDYFAEGIVRAGHRLHRSIAYNSEFQMLTLPTTTRGTALVSAGKGIKVHHLHYWSNAFRDPRVEQTRVPVRYDPYDIGVAYAYVGNCWVACHSEHYATFRGRSEREILLATAELRKRMQNHSRHLPLTARRLADFIASVESEESLLLQQRRDAELKRVHSGKAQHTELGEPNAQSNTDEHTEMSTEGKLEQVPLRSSSAAPEEYEAY
jgi:transposase InsO family protein